MARGYSYLPDYREKELDPGPPPKLFLKQVTQVNNICQGCGAIKTSNKCEYCGGIQ